MQSDLSSSINIGKRVSESKIPNHYLPVDSIPSDEVCVVYFGGTGAEHDEIANGYAKIVQNEILNKIKPRVSIYTVTYNFGANEEEFYISDPILSRRIAYIEKGMYQNKQNTKDVLDIAEPEDYNPTYVQQLAEKIIFPRISCDGKKISVIQAAQQIRKLNIVAHCHGGYVALKMEEVMQKMMENIGYTKEERNFIQSQLLILAHAPECPLGVSRSQFISFLSMGDEQLKQADNWFNKYVRDRQKEEKKRIKAEENEDTKEMEKYRMFPFEASFFPARQGNFFLIKRKFMGIKEEKLLIKKEHADIHYTDDKTKTAEGRIVTFFARNILVNSIQNSLAQNRRFVPLPNLEQLILSGKGSLQKRDAVYFKKMKENGESFWAELKKERIIYARYLNLKKEIEERHALIKE